MGSCIDGSLVCGFLGLHRINRSDDEFDNCRPAVMEPESFRTSWGSDPAVSRNESRSFHFPELYRFTIMLRLMLGYLPHLPRLLWMGQGAAQLIHFQGLLQHCLD